MRLKISAENNIPHIMITKLKKVININEVKIDTLTLSINFAPKYCEMTTPQPIPHPFATVIRTKVIGYEAPTAARASALMQFPTIIESIML